MLILISFYFLIDNFQATDFSNILENKAQISVVYQPEISSFLMK